MAISLLMILPLLAAPMLRITQRFCIVTDLKRGFRTVATATVMRAGCDKKEGRGPVEPPSDPAHTDNTQQADQSDDSMRGEDWNWYWWCVSDHDKAAIPSIGMSPADRVACLITDAMWAAWCCAASRGWMPPVAG